jgi:hypothetical protein
VIHGSISTTLPDGVSRRNAAWPYHVSLALPPTAWGLSGGLPAGGAGWASAGAADAAAIRVNATIERRVWVVMRANVLLPRADGASRARDLNVTVS